MNLSEADVDHDGLGPSCALDVYMDYGLDRVFIVCNYRMFCEDMYITYFIIYKSFCSSVFLVYILYCSSAF